MKFAGPDLMISKFQTDIIVVSGHIFTEEALHEAAARLLAAWPFLSYRTTLTRSGASEHSAESVSHGFLSVSKADGFILPKFAGSCVASGITVYDGNAVGDLFESMPWHKLLRPRIFTTQAVISQDATIFKFTLQHAAGDACGLYNAVAAFCDGLSRPILDRSTTERKYSAAGYSKSGLQWHSIRSRLQTQQAGDWWSLCTGNKLFPIATLVNKWQDARRNSTQWKTIHIQECVLEKWRGIALEAGVKVSTFDLFASWVHMNLADFARSLDPNIPERFAFTASVRDHLQPQAPNAELWNPFTIAIAGSLPQVSNNRQSILVSGAASIRAQINTVRGQEYVQDYSVLMDKAPLRQGQIRSMGKRIPVSMLLTSWSQSPFPDLKIQGNTPAFVQPIIGCLPFIPLPEKYMLDRQVGVVWKGKENDGMWFTANVEEELWKRILDVAF